MRLGRRERFELEGAEDHLIWKNMSKSEIRMLSYQRNRRHIASRVHREQWQILQKSQDNYYNALSNFYSYEGEWL